MNLKQIAGEKAAEYVEDGMVLGLGTGSTVYYTILKVGELVKDGYELIGIPTSRAPKSWPSPLEFNWARLKIILRLI